MTRAFVLRDDDNNDENNYCDLTIIIIIVIIIVTSMISITICNIVANTTAAGHLWKPA